MRIKRSDGMIRLWRNMIRRFWRFAKFFFLSFFVSFCFIPSRFRLWSCGFRMRKRQEFRCKSDCRIAYNYNTRAIRVPVLYGSIYLWFSLRISRVNLSLSIGPFFYYLPFFSLLLRTIFFLQTAVANSLQLNYNIIQLKCWNLKNESVRCIIGIIISLYLLILSD